MATSTPKNNHTTNTLRVQSWRNKVKIIWQFVVDYESMHQYIDIPDELDQELTECLEEVFHLRYSFDERAIEIWRAELVRLMISLVKNNEAVEAMCQFSKAVSVMLKRIQCAQCLQDGTEDGLIAYESEMEDIIETANLNGRFKEVVKQLK